MLQNLPEPLVPPEPQNLQDNNPTEKPPKGGFSVRQNPTNARFCKAKQSLNGLSALQKRALVKMWDKGKGILSH